MNWNTRIKTFTKEVQYNEIQYFSTTEGIHGQEVQLRLKKSSNYNI